MPALKFKTCRLLSGNVWNKELTIVQRRILGKLRMKKRSIKKKIYSRKNRNSYIQLQTTRKLSLFYGNLPITKMHRRTKRTSYIPFLLNLETRLDVILVRLHFCETIPQARQLISHRKVCVNNGIVNISHFQVSHGDIISFQENYARTRGEEIRRFFYIKILVEKIIGKFWGRMPLDKIFQYERTILNSAKPELLQSLKGGLTNEKKRERLSLSRRNPRTPARRSPFFYEKAVLALILIFLKFYPSLLLGFIFKKIINWLGHQCPVLRPIILGFGMAKFGQGAYEFVFLAVIPDLNLPPAAEPPAVEPALMPAPLWTDDVRRAALRDRLTVPSALGNRTEMSQFMIESLVDYQVLIEKEVEGCLLQEGHGRAWLQQRWPQIRNHIFRGERLRISHYQRLWASIQEQGVENCAPLKRVLRIPWWPNTSDSGIRLFPLQ